MNDRCSERSSCPTSATSAVRSFTDHGLAGSRAAPFDHEQVAAKLSTELGREVTARTLPISRLAFGDGFVELQVDERWFRWILADSSLTVETEPSGVQADEPPARNERRNGRSR